jgi:SAM-dependent methyltransferase
MVASTLRLLFLPLAAREDGLCTDCAAILVREMNALENWFCSSRIWRRMTERTILPWLLDGAELGDHVLEIGAGAGAASSELRRRARRVTSLEFSHQLAVKASRHNGWPPVPPNASVVSEIVQGDATRLPFPPCSFSSALAVLMLHHLSSAREQDRAFGEAFRVLRPGGVFLAFEIQDRWLQRVTHFKSTFTPLRPDTLNARLSAVGFASVCIDRNSEGLRLCASRSA